MPANTTQNSGILQKLKEIEQIYRTSLKDMRQKILVKLDIIAEGEAEDSNKQFEELLQKEKTTNKSSKIGKGLVEIDTAVESAISSEDGGQGEPTDVIALLNISVGEQMNKKMYLEMIYKFYTCINHHMYA